jgi:hypothetical protein
MLDQDATIDIENIQEDSIYQEYEPEIESKLNKIEDHEDYVKVETGIP